MGSHQKQEQETRFTMQRTVPLTKEPGSFKEKQKVIWEQMQKRMDERRKEWDEDVIKLKRDFFKLKPEDISCGAVVSGINEGLLEKMNLENMFQVEKDGSKVFRVSFDVSQFKAEEINVKTQDNKLIVQAKHEEKGAHGGEKMVSREFSRQVDIPNNVDPLKMQSVLTNDGILQVEAPVSNQENAQLHPRIPIHSTSISSDKHLGKQTSSQQTSENLDSIVQDINGNKMFRVTFELGTNFEADDLNVKTIDRKLIVQARHEEKKDGKIHTKEFNKEFELPELVDPNQVTAQLTPEGHLVLEAPVL